MTNEQREQYLNELIPDRKVVETYNKVLKYKIPILIAVFVLAYILYSNL